MPLLLGNRPPLEPCDYGSIHPSGERRITPLGVIFERISYSEVARMLLLLGSWVHSVRWSGMRARLTKSEYERTVIDTLRYYLM
jgi:hypothetical protein